MKFCIYPLLVFNVTPNFVVPCCYSYMQPKFRSEMVVDITKCGTAWNSDKWIEFRKRIAAQDYSMCTACSLYINKDTEFYDENRLRAEYPDYADTVLKMLGGEGDVVSPDTVILSFDPTCNLACPTCRGFVYHEPNDTHLSAIVESVSGILNSAKHIVIAGDGELCMSKHYIDILQNRTGSAKLTIMSNGTLLTESFLNRIPDDVKQRIEKVNISCDGTTKQVYEATRRNGVFENFIANMESLMSLRDQYGFATKLLYTISTLNANDYLNLPAFARQLKFDKIGMTVANKWYRMFNNQRYVSANLITDDDQKAKIEKYINLLNKSYKR